MAVLVLLRPVGYWTSRPGDGLPDPRGMMSMRWEVHRRSLIAAYLGSAPVLDALDEAQPCAICGADGGRRERTDGAWRWPETLAHYVASHSVRLPDELIRHMEINEFRPPAVDVKHLRDNLAPTNPVATSLISKATAAAALDDMLGNGSGRPKKKERARPPAQQPELAPPPVTQPKVADIDDATLDVPSSTAWTASVRGVPTKPQLIRFDRPIVLGRDRTCDVVLEHSSVSRRHARLVPLDDRVIVQDLDSQNGVWMRKVRCAGQVEVKDGQEVSLGQATITLLR